MKYNAHPEKYYSHYHPVNMTICPECGWTNPRIKPENLRAIQKEDATKAFIDRFWEREPDNFDDTCDEHGAFVAGFMAAVNYLEGRES